MKTYALTVRSNGRDAALGLTCPLTPEVLARAVADLVVHELGQDEWGRDTIRVGLDRATDAEALDEIVDIVQQFGWTVLEVQISEWASQATKTAFLFAAGGGAVGAASKDPLVMLVATAISAVVGSMVGSEMRKIAEYEARWHYRSGWSFHQLQPQDGQGWEPGFSPA
ncbi:MAG: hypothetical protein QOJ29_3343 [Thermoleophilaceae bacterium]|nr:hypothetical protein [Thermoleophilaceae bacterium]